jgi:hypothetical protein
VIRDINEQMAELAPSQNIRLGEPVEAGKFQSAMDSPSSATAAAYMTGSGMAQMAGFNMARAMQVEPDRAARASQLAAETNIPQALVLGNMEDVERRKNVRAWSDAATKDRVLAELLRDREFAETAQDDLEPMSAWSRFRSSVADLNQYREDLWFGTMRGIAEEGQGIASGWRLGRLTAQRGFVGSRIAMQGEYAGDRELMGELNEELRNLARPETFLAPAAEFLGQQTVTLPEMAGEAALGATIGGAAGFMGGLFAPITVPGGMALGATAGAATGRYRTALRVEAGNHFADLVQQGVPEDEARQIALGVGVINASLELIGFGIVTAPLRTAFRSVIREGMSQALRQTTTRAALGTFAKQYGQAIAGEVTTEVLQEVTNIIGEELAADIAPEAMESQLATPEGQAALVSRLTDTAKHVAMAMVVLGPIAPSANLYTNMRAVAATKKQQRFYEELRSNKDASKLAKRAPALYQRAAAAQLRGTDAETTYIRADAMREVLAQAGITAEQAEAVIPGLRQMLEQALVAGGDITIPTADYVAKLMGTKVGDLMQQHVRLTAEAKSLRELAAAQAEREQVIREAEAVMKAKTEADTAFVQSAKDVEDRILAMLKATGRMSAEQAEVNARIVRDFYVVQAAKMGKTPGELYAERPYTVRGAGMAAPLEQANQFDQSGQRRTDTPEFKAWSKDAPIIQGTAEEFASGKPFVSTAYHGTSVGDIGAFDPLAPSQFRKELERGMGAVWFGAEPDIATNFAGVRGAEQAITYAAGSVYPVYVTMQNPLVVDAATEAQPDQYVRLRGGQVVYDIMFIKQAAIARAKREGHDGVVFVNAYDGAPVGGKATIYAVFNPSDIKSVNNRGTWSRTTTNIMEQAARIDADYMAAVERGDMETAQRLVDEAARASGYTIEAEHQTNEWFSEFKAGELGFHIGLGIPEGMLGQRTMKLRARITNPLRLKDIGVWSAERVIYSLPESIITDRERSELLDEIPEEMRTGSPEGGDMFAYYEALAPIREFLTSKGYDGIVYKNEAEGREDSFIAFDPEQLKSADPITRDEAGNIVPLSRRFDITSPRIFEQAAAGPRLMAVHNLSADNLQFAERMGGLAVPSIGVITQEAGGVEGFGEITLLGTREMVEPRTTPVFEADAYSARFPRPEWPKVRVAKADAIVKQIRDAAKQYGDTTIVDKTFDGMVNQPDAERVADEWLRSHAIQALFLRTKGIEVQPVMREAKSLTTLSWDAVDRLRPLYEAVNWQQSWENVEASAEFAALQSAYANEVRRTYAAVSDEFAEGQLNRMMRFDMRAYQRLLRDLQTKEREVVSFGGTQEALDNALQPYKAEFKTYVDNTIRSQFDAPFLRDGKLKRPYTLGNIVDFMASSKVRGEEKGMTFGAGAARAKRARAFPDLEEMREAAKTAIVNPQEYAKARKESEKTLEAYRLAVVDYTRLTDWRGKQDTWAAMDASMKALARYGKRKKRNAKAMREALSREQFAVGSMPAELIEQAIDAADTLFNAPVPYFEAKPQRAVRLDEFAGAVIPTDASQQTRDILERSGIPYMSYMAGNEEDRQRAVRQMAVSPEARGEVLFQAAPVSGPRIFEQAPVTPGFYSAMATAIDAIDAKSMAASGWKDRIKGLVKNGLVKQEEVDWSGLTDWLDMQEGKVTKEAVAEFLKNNGVRVERVQLGGDIPELTRKVEELRAEFEREEAAFQEAKEAARIASEGTDIDAARATELRFREARRTRADVSNRLSEAEEEARSQRQPATKYGQYTLPGGTNYREVLITLPQIAPSKQIFRKHYQLYKNGQLVAVGDEISAVRWREQNPDADIRVVDVLDAQAMKRQSAGEEAFISTHWDQLNVLVHFRLNDRVDADGKRVLFVEEIQSDWGQAGVTTGFSDQQARDESALQELLAQAGDKPSESQTKQIQRLRKRLQANEYDIPLAPFVENTDGWLNLALKHILLEATQGNYDRVAFVNGNQSAERYDLSNQIDSIVYRKNDDGTYDVEAIKNSSVLVTKKNQQASQIEELIGKEITQRIVNGDGEQPADYPGEYKELSGLDLKVGGKGMMEFYDKIVPAAVNKLLKKYGGGKLGTVEIDIRTPESEAWYREPTAEELPAQPGFPVTPEMVKKLESGLPLFQAAPVSGPRGAFDPARLTTILNEGADASTFLHETAHAFLHMYSIFASAPNGPQSIKDDMDKTLAWFGIAGATAEERLNAWNRMTVDQQRPYHEQFAYNWELYMFEGKAPTAELQGIFERFSAWLRRVYRSIRDELNVIYRREFGRDLPILTGEVAQVMDRMIASEDEIAFQQAVNDMKPHFQTQDESGMSDAEWAAYQQLRAEADEAAVTDLSRASMKQMEWLEGARSQVLRKLQAKHNKLRGDIRREVTELMARDPYYQALSFMRTGKARLPNGAEVTSEGATRLSMAAVRQINDQLPMDRLIDLNRLPNGILAEDGLAPDVVAEMFGFSSGEEMLRSMVDMKPLRDAIRDRVDARMLAHSGLLDPDVQEAEIQKALHNEARKRFVAVENRFISGSTQPTKVMIEAAEQVAREVINSRVYRDLRPSDYTAAEARAAGDAAKAYTVRRTPEQVGQSAYTRTYNQQKAAGADDATAEAAATAASANAAAAAQARLEAFRREYGDASPEAVVRRAIQTQMYQSVLAGEAATAKEELATGVRYLRRVLRDENVAKMGAGYADQIRAILSRFDLSPITVAAAQEREALSTWLAGLEKAGIVPDLAPEVLNEALTISYRNMTVEQLRGVIDSVKQLEYVGKNERKVQLAKQRADFEVVKDGIVARIDEVAQAKGRKAKAETATTNLGRAGDAINGFFASHMKAASIVRILDGGEDGGPLWQYLIRTANEAGNREVRMRAEATEGLTKIMQPLLALGPMGGSGVMFPTINRRLNRESRLAIALNTGNAGNIQRLLDGEGWSLDQIMPVLESLTSQEWEAVQAIWDWLERYRPMIAEKERRLYGKEPQWVEPVPFTIRTKDGSVATLRGGYYPIKYDPRSSRLTQAQNEAEEAKRQMQGAYTSATTRRSFTKSRVREVKGRRLLYTMDGLYNGVNEVIHDLTWHEWLISANRLMRSDNFDNAVRSQYGPDWVNELRYWIRDVAVGEGSTQAAGEQFLSMVRQNVSATGLGLNVISAAIQVTGFAQSATRVGFKFLGRGIATLMSSPLESGRMVNDRSQFMADRSRTQFRELAELKNIVRGQTTAMRQLRAATYFLLLRVQRAVDLATWIGAYEKAANEGRSDSDATAIADQTVIDTQGSGMYKDLARIERGGPALKLFTVFYQYMNVVANLTTVQVMTAKSRGQLAADLMMILVVPVLLDQLIRNALRPAADDADEPELDAIAKQLAAAQLEYLMGTIFGVRELAQIARIVTGAEGVRGYEGPAGLRGFGETIRFAQQASQGEFDTAFRRSAVNMLGITMGIPSAQINRTIDGIEALMEGEVEGVAAPLAPLTGVRR